MNRQRKRLPTAALVVHDLRDVVYVFVRYGADDACYVCGDLGGGWFEWAIVFTRVAVLFLDQKQS